MAGVAARVVLRNGCVDPTVGEALASLHTVQFCQELGLSCIILEGDAQLIVIGINSSSRNWSKFGHVLEEIRTVVDTKLELQTC